MNATEAHLTNVWHALKDSANATEIAKTEGALQVLVAVGLLTEIEADGWRHRFEQCPGHDNEGGRSWCAFCGDIDRDAVTADPSLKSVKTHAYAHDCAGDCHGSDGEPTCGGMWGAAY